MLDSSPLRTLVLGSIPVILLLGACGAHVSQPEWRAPAAERAGDPGPAADAPAVVTPSFTPSGEPAAWYGVVRQGPPLAPLDGDVARAIAATAARWGHPVPVVDARLSQVAADLARLPRVGGGPPSDVIQFALSHHGIVEPSPYLLFYGIADQDSGAMIAHLESDLPEVLATSPFVRLGVAHAPAGPGETLVVIALQEGAVKLDPAPRELPRGGSFRLRGAVTPPYRSPQLYVTAADGAVHDLPVVRDGDEGFRADVSCGRDDGRLKVEVVAEDKAHNPTVLANFAVWCGERAPRSVAVAARAAVPDDAAAVETEILLLVNRERAKAGLRPLLWSDLAAGIARAHSTEMRDKAYVAHVSPVTGSPSDRAKAGGLGTPLLLENLARAQSAREAHHGIMDSPGHRGNLLNPDVTHVGIGVAVPAKDSPSARDLYVTQLFFRVPPRRDTATLRRETAAAIAGARAKASLEPLTVDAELDRIAHNYAAGLAAGKDREDLGRAAGLALDRVAEQYIRIISVISVVGDPADAVRDAALEPRARTYGLGVAQGRHPQLGEAALHVVMMFGIPR